MGPPKSGIVLNVEQFIKDVEARPAIWNRNYHCNKYFLEQTWQELCKIHKLPANVLKAKWKGLRDNFRVEFKRIPRNPDGQLAFPPEYYQSKWNHFLSLQFLVDHMRQRGVKYENTSQNCDETLNGDDEECIVEPDIHDVLVSNCIEGSDDIPDDLETQITNYKRKQLELANELNGIGNLSVNGSLHSSATSTVEFSIPSKKLKQIDNNDETLDLSTNKNSRNLNNTVRDQLSTSSSILNDINQSTNHISEVLNLSNHNFNNSVGHNNGLGISRYDDDFYYLMSLHPFMHSLSPPKKLKVRTKIQKLILKELYKRPDL